MYLKRIELSGFKSFGKKTTLDFSTPVVAIVGPNGSGKSNVVEAIRFVLGEQSMKSMRGKGSGDLIFKGSKGVPAGRKASVAITFDNTKRVFSFSGTHETNISIDFDEITITREVDTEGGSTYRINGTEVRLKDIVDLLSSVHIGASGHHIISQGEADRLLTASPKDRKLMVEDALGLKTYQIKIRDSERKLERATEHLREVGLQRKEIAPHLQYLKKQVEKFEKAGEMRTELAHLYTVYLFREANELRSLETITATERQSYESELRDLKATLATYEEEKALYEKKDTLDDVEYQKKEQELEALKKKVADRERAISRIEGAIEALSFAPKQQTSSDGYIEKAAVIRYIDEIEQEIALGAESEDVALLQHTMAKVGQILHEARTIILRQTANISAESSPEKLEALNTQLQDLRGELSKELALLEEAGTTFSSIERTTKTDTQATRLFFERYYETRNRIARIEGDVNVLKVKESHLALRSAQLLEDERDAAHLAGIDPLALSDNTDILESQEELKKNIDRIKFKLEDIGGGSGGDVMKEYEDTKTRDEFLARETGDIEESINHLRTLIKDLRKTLDARFSEGVNAINSQFGEFFSLMFGGGSAFISVIAQNRVDEEDDLSDRDTGDIHLERGIEIHVTLPHKKVKDLHMLSGGERSLTSIALLFAMSQVNPPPFLVLDETDAALDEANSRRYGDMIENLSKVSQLVVVTHNRETMSRAEILYGVTIGADGASKLLSIKFEDAVLVAK